MGIFDKPPNLQPYVQYFYLVRAIDAATRTMTVDGKDVDYIDPAALLTELRKYIGVDYS